MRTPHLVVFDLDGTLVDSIGDLVAAVNVMVSELGGHPLDRAAVSSMVGEGAGALVARALPASGVAADPAVVLPRFLEIYDGLLPGTTRPYPGIPELLRALGGTVPLAVLTNKPTLATRRILSLLDLDGFFFGVIGGDGAFPRKPSPEGLLHLAAEAGVAPGRTLMVGDSTVDLRTARAAGATACIVRYGFGFAGFDRERLHGGEVFVDRPAEIATLLLGAQDAG